MSGQNKQQESMSDSDDDQAVDDSNHSSDHEQSINTSIDFVSHSLDDQDTDRIILPTAPQKGLKVQRSTPKNLGMKF